MRDAKVSVRRCVSTRAGAMALLAACGAAVAGGTPENVLILVDPSSQESMYLANYYRFKRNIPASNVVYIDPGAASYAAFAGANGPLDGVLGTLAVRGIEDHIDLIAIAVTDRFYVSAPGIVTDGCFPVGRFSLSSVYTMAHLRPQLLAGNVPSTTANHYFSINTANPVAFDSNTAYLGGSPSTSPSARRYFIGAQLGYTGTLGTTLGDVFQMIDRSVAVDGTSPAGTFYYMNNLADPIRNIRACGSLQGCNGPVTIFTGAVTAMSAAGGSAQIVSSILPSGMSDCLGILTGAEFPNIDGETMTILPGAFCDHLTSWAGTFDNPNQVKMSAWIRRGASGTSGTVEEPCAYPGKFPHANMHVLYRRGLSLGEAHLRSLAYVPFQQLLLGDPITRPWATFPTITPNIAGGNVAGQWTFTPSAGTTLPGATISAIELYIDGVLAQSRLPGQAFSIDTTALADGHHDVRLIAYDSTTVKNAGRWVGSIRTANHGRSVGLNVSLANADLITPITASITTAGSGTLQEYRLLQNGRIVAAGGTAAPLLVYGRNLGAGRSELQAEVLYTDGRLARSEPFEVNVTYSGGAASAVPTAFSYSRRVAPGSTAVIELPAAYPDNPAAAAYTLVAGPAQASVGGGSLGYRVVTVPAGATGADTLQFRVTTPAGQSGIATVTLIYSASCYANCDASTAPPVLNVADFTCFLQRFAAGDSYANCDGSSAAPVLNVADFTCFLQRFAGGCP